MRQVANGLQMGETLEGLMYIVAVSIPLLFIVGREIFFVFYCEVHATPLEKLIIKKMNDKLIIQYLDWLQKELKCTNSIRNQ